MTDKIIEDVYNQVRRRKWGPPLLALAGLLVVAFTLWSSLPDSIKERLILGSKPTSPVPSTVPEKAAVGDITDIPDLSKASGTYSALTASDLVVQGGTIHDVSPEGVEGYFDVIVPPSSNVYGSANVLMKNSLPPNFFLTARVAGNEHVGTLELRGLGVYFLLNNQDNSYMIYNSEENQTPWTPLPFSRDVQMNTMGLYQADRHVDVFLNSKYIASFKLWNVPTPGQVGLSIKTNPQGEGIVHFQRLSAYELPATESRPPSP